jgi:hypothetical protein
MILPLLFFAIAGVAPRDAEIREMVRRAEAAYLAKNWDAASRGFADAYAVDPNPDYLFARAQAERFAGRCNVALDIWDRYLTVETSAEAIAEAKTFRSYCESPSASTANSGTLAHPSTTADEPRTAPPSRVKWYRDPAGGVLVATGGVSAIIGGSLLGFAISRDRKAGGAATEGAYVDAKDAVEKPHRAGIAMLATGGALLVGGIIRWAVVARGKGGRKRGDASLQSKASRVRLGPSLGLRF